MMSATSILRARSGDRLPVVDPVDRPLLLRIGAVDELAAAGGRIEQRPRPCERRRRHVAGDLPPDPVTRRLVDVAEPVGVEPLVIHRAREGRRSLACGRRDADPDHRRRGLRRREPGRRAGRARTRAGSSSRSTTCTAAGRSSTCRGSSAPGSSSCAPTSASASALAGVAPLDALIECSAEPSALVGMSGDTSYPFETNLVGAYNCLELARRDGAQVVFLSTSRVYPYPALNDARAAPRRDPVRARARAGDRRRRARPGSRRASRSTAPRTLYGATKLAAELLVDRVRGQLRPARPSSTAAA